MSKKDCEIEVTAVIAPMPGYGKPIRKHFYGDYDQRAELRDAAREFISEQLKSQTNTHHVEIIDRQRFLEW